MTDTIPIPQFQHRNHIQWLKDIDFYQEQINIFQKELVYALHHHNDLFSIIEQVDEYREILFRKLNKLDEIRRQIILHEKAIAHNFDESSVKIWDHLEVKDEMEKFIDAFENLKINLRRFVSHQIKK